jgi:UDP-N-acetylglucosamine 2-epimerase (non-hydrolysing)
VIAVIWGTRPEAIKLGPVVAELQALKVPLTLLCTGQHTDLLKGTPAETDLLGSISLGLRSMGDVPRWTRTAERQLRWNLRTDPPDLVVVQGDTMSAVAGARAAHACQIPIAHVEAGIRSYNLLEPWPEEGYRVEITKFADWHYAPTLHARENLLAEDIPNDRILVTGNPGISAIARYTKAVPIAQAQTPTILVTLHRRELLANPDLKSMLQALMDAMKAFSDITFVWPTHPVVAPVLAECPDPASNLRIIKPLDYCACVTGLPLLLGVLTDSGGLQEEAATLGVPCAVFRNVTDRPESVEAGIAQVFPTTPRDAQHAVQTLASATIARHPAPVFGDTLSASRIATHLSTIGVPQAV